MHRGPARVFDSEEAAFDAVQRQAIKPGDVVVIRYEGPAGGPGMREMLARDGGDRRRRARRVGARCSPTAASRARRAASSIGHIAPEASRGGPIAAIRDGDIIVLDVANRTLDVELSDDGDRSSGWRRGRRRRRGTQTGVLAKYARLVSSASTGAVTG